ncbi:MAG: hypothetical protein IT462_14175 [Planctomycetes bacterium]|nr:hypothetical protein [Planctomycetota bacterium]
MAGFFGSNNGLGTVVTPVVACASGSQNWRNRMFRQIACGGLVVAVLFLAQTPVRSDSVRPLERCHSQIGTIDDPPAEDDPCAQAKWLTWSLKDYQGRAISLTSYQNKKVFVVVFAPGNEDSCTMVRKAAEYCRDHEGTADRVLAFCSDNKGADAIKLYLRQEEWAKRVKAWNDEQAIAKAAAEAGEQTYEAPAMPDYLKAIEDEQKTADGLAMMMNHHLPFKTCSRCELMWTWLVAKMAKPEGAPRLLKINPQGSLLNEWSETADNPNPLADD